MKVIAIPKILDAFEWDGSEGVFRKINELAENVKDKVYMRDGQLMVYDNIFEGEEVVDIGDYIVFNDHRIEVWSFTSFEALYQEVADD